MIGHSAIKKPSQAALIVFRKLCCQIATDNSAEIIKEPKAALYVGHPSTVNANISHKMGQSPKIKYKKFISSLPCTFELYQSVYVCQKKNAKNRRVSVIKQQMRVKYVVII